MARDEARRRILLTDNVDDVFAVEVARLSEEGLLAFVVVFGLIFEVPRDSAVWPDGIALAAQRHILGVAQRPAGEGARRFLDVFLRVVAHAHAEQL